MIRLGEDLGKHHHEHDQEGTPPAAARLRLVRGGAATGGGSPAGGRSAAGGGARARGGGRVVHLRGSLGATATGGAGGDGAGRAPAGGAGGGRGGPSTGGAAGPAGGGAGGGRRGGERRPLQRPRVIDLRRARGRGENPPPEAGGGQDRLQADWKDILALIIATFEVLGPFLLMLFGVAGVAYLLLRLLAH